MNKVLVEVYVPSVNVTYDAYLPLDSKIKEIGILLAKGISDLTDNRYLAGKEIIITDYETGKQYPNNLKILDTNIDNGHKIMLS